jgi:hypothetical protein
MPDCDNRRGWIITILVSIALISGIVWLCTGCSLLGGSQRTAAAHAAVEQKLAEIQADGVVTPEEAQVYVSVVREAWKIEKEETAGGFEDVLKGFATGSVPAGIAALLLNVFRNRKSEKEWGTPDAPKDAVSLELQTKGVIAPKT